MTRPFSTRKRRFLSCGLSLGATLLLAGCGSGGTSSSGAVDLGGPTGTGGFTGVVTTRSAVVSLDVDGDALPDLVAVGRDGSGAGAAWRNLGRGAWAAAPSAWRDGPVVGALVDDTERRDDATLAQGYAVHPLERAGHASIPYSVLHLGDGAGVALGAPVLDAIEPASGSTHQLVRLEGSALASAGVATTVTFGSASATVLYAFPELVLAVVPEGLPLGPIDVRVARGDVVCAPITFEVTATAVPVVTSIVPSTVAPGELAVIRGERLGTPLDHVEVSFEGAAPVAALGLGSACAVIVPADAVTGPMRVTVEGVASEPFEATVGARPAPEVHALVPASASVGSLVRIEGTDLLAPAQPFDVTFGSVRAAIFSVDEGSLTVIVPTGAVDGDVVVHVGDQAAPGVAFDVVARGAPHVMSVSPTSGAAGNPVEILGTDLVDLSAWRPGRLPPLPLFGDLKVTIGGKDAWFVLPTAGGLRVIVPTGATSSGLVVTVHGVASAVTPFDVP